MVVRAVAPIKGRVIRIVKLDVCGNPVTGASSAMLVSKSFTSIQMSPDYEEGEEFITKLADGTLCVNEKDPASLKRVGLEMHFCTLDSDLVTLTTGETQILTGSGSVTGTGNMFGEDVLDDHFSLEVWQNVAGAGNCDPTGSPYYVYWAFPNVTNTMLQDMTIENGVFDFVIAGETMRVGTLWLDSPGATTWLPAGVTVPAGKHFLYNVTTTAPPAVTNGAVTLA